MQDTQTLSRQSQANGLQTEFPLYPIRPTSGAVILVTIIAATLGIGLSNYYFFARQDSVIWDVQLATAGWLNANLLMFIPLTLLITGGLIMFWGQQRLADLGLRGNWFRQLVFLLVAVWSMVQLLAIIAVAVTGTEIKWHLGWSEHGVGAMLGFLLAMVFGTALFEDSVFRGYLLPQIYLQLESHITRHWLRLAVVLLLCALIFSLWHLPTILLNRDVDITEMLAALAYMLLGGVMLGLLFLRTGNLPLVIVLHALVNAPTLVVASPVSGSLLAGLIGLGAIIAGPKMVGRPWNIGFIRPVADQSTKET